MIKFSQRFVSSAGRYCRSLSTLPKVRRSENFKALLVGGISDPESEIRHAAWDLFSDIYDLPPTSMKKILDKVETMIDTSTSLRKVKQKDVDRVLRFIRSADECDDGCATCAIFAHGHGAKIVAKAFEEETIDEFVQEHPDIRCDISKKMQENVAVFTLGAIENLEENRAKLCVNLQLETDSMSYLGKRWFGKQEREQSDHTLVLPDKGEKRRDTSFLGHLFRCASVGHCDHSLRDYLSAENIMDHIRRSLSPPENKDCRCSGAQAELAPGSCE